MKITAVEIPDYAIGPCGLGLKDVDGIGTDKVTFAVTYIGTPPPVTIRYEREYRKDSNVSVDQTTGRKPDDQT